VRQLSDNHLRVLIAAAAALLFIPFLGAVNLFDWDEVNFAECAREMLVTEDYLSLQMNFKPFWEKPPFFIWLSALSMNFFGVNEFAARLPNALCGIITLVFVFNMGARFFSRRLAVLWVFCYAGSILPQFYFHSGIIDPWFNLFICHAVYFLILFTGEDTGSKTLRLFLSAVFIGLAVLTKGPVAIIIYLACILIYLLAGKATLRVNVKQFLVWIFTVIITCGTWFILLLLKGRQDVIEQFISYQVHLFGNEDSGHGGPFYYHALVLLAGCFPASVFALPLLVKKTEGEPSQRIFKRWMLILFWVVLVLFSLVKTKIIHYSSLCYFPLTFFAALTLHELVSGSYVLKKWMKVLLLIVASLIGILLCMIPFVGIYKSKVINSGLINDDFAVANLQADVSWSGFEAIAGLMMIMTAILFIRFFKRNKPLVAIVVLFAGTIVVTELICLVFVPKIEAYTQKAAIDFYREKRTEDCYVKALGYHSYAQYFYTQRKLPAERERLEVDWMLHGKLDKPAYFVSKITHDETNRKDYPQIKEISRKNGYVFYIRRPE
jgi:hypothetical protein